MENKAVNQTISKKDKVFRIINYCLLIILFFTCVGLGIYYYLIGDPNNRLLASVGVSLLFLAPILIELIFRCRISNFVMICFIVYSVLAGILGCLLNFYNINTLKLNDWYDVFIHTLAGYVFSFVGLIVISKLQDYKKLSPWTILLFCVFLTLATELVWELMEWFADSCLGQNSQGHPPVGQPAPLVTDTNLDMLCNFSGSILFAIHFIISKFTKVKLGMNYVERELCEKKLFTRKPKKYNKKTNNESVLLEIDKTDTQLQGNNEESYKINTETENKNEKEKSKD